MKGLRDEPSPSVLRTATSPEGRGIGRPGQPCCSLGPDGAQGAGPCSHWQRHLYCSRESRQRSPTVPDCKKLRSSSTTTTDSPVALPLGELAPKVTERVLLPAVPPLPSKAGAAPTACRPCPSRENGTAERPQAFRCPKPKNHFSAEDAQSKAAGILNRLSPAIAAQRHIICTPPALFRCGKLQFSPPFPHGKTAAARC